MEGQGGTMGGGGAMNVCRCPHHKMVPILVILFGALFLLGALDMVSAWTVSIGWPILVIVGGFTKLMKNKCKCC